MTQKGTYNGIVSNAGIGTPTGPFNKMANAIDAGGLFPAVPGPAPGPKPTPPGPKPGPKPPTEDSFYNDLSKTIGKGSGKGGAWHNFNLPNWPKESGNLSTTQFTNYLKSMYGITGVAKNQTFTQALTTYYSAVANAGKSLGPYPGRSASAEQRQNWEKQFKANVYSALGKLNSSLQSASGGKTPSLNLEQLATATLNGQVIGSALVPDLGGEKVGNLLANILGDTKGYL